MALYRMDEIYYALKLNGAGDLLYHICGIIHSYPALEKDRHQAGLVYAEITFLGLFQVRCIIEANHVSVIR